MTHQILFIAIGGSAEGRLGHETIVEGGGSIPVSWQ